LPIVDCQLKSNGRVVVGKFGNWKSEIGNTVMETLFKNIRYALRVLTKRPAFSAIVVITLALGIGANTAIFTVVDAALLRGLPYKNPERLMQVWENTTQEKTNQREASYPDFIDWKTNNRTFESMTGFGQAGLILNGSDSSDMIAGGRVSADFFHVLGVEAMLGRAMTAGDDQPGAERVVVVSHGTWERRFGSDRNLVGKSITLSSSAYTVVGVLPAGFQFAPLGDAELFVPLDPPAEIRGRRFMHFVRVVGRLKDGVTLQQAQSDMNAVGAGIAQADPNGHANLTLKLVSLHDQIVGNVRPILLVLLVAVAFVLLIACANVANLFLVHSASRQKEMAVRVALGASRSQLASQLLIESLLLSVVGGLFGLGLAHWGVGFLVNAIPPTQLARMPYLRGVGLNGNILGYTGVISLLSGVIFALVPVLQANKADLHETLKEGGRSSGTAVRSRLRNGLVAAELALTLMLMIGVGLLLKSTFRLLKVDPGFDTRNLLTLRVALIGPGYAKGSQRAAFQQQLIERLQALPGVKGVASAGKLPLGGGGDTGTPIIDGRTNDAKLTGPEANVRTVSANYFGTMGVPLVMGRDFSAQDTLDAPHVLVVNQAFVRTFFPNQNALSHQLSFVWNSEPRTIVGVVGDENVNTLDAAITPVIYFPYTQDPEQDLNVVVRTTQDPLSLASAVRSEIRSLDRALPVFGMTSMSQMIEDSPSTFTRRYPALLIGVFAGVAMLLAAIGLYGVISYSVAQRTQELGVRIALGAQRRDIFRLVLGQGIAVTIIGVAIGLAASFALTRFLSSLLFEVSPNDPLIIGGVVVLMIIVALAASYFPTRRATKVDPLVALRYE
jgi:putative ABC transport system permease protein